MITPERMICEEGRNKIICHVPQETPPAAAPIGRDTVMVEIAIPDGRIRGMIQHIGNEEGIQLGTTAVRLARLWAVI